MNKDEDLKHANEFGDIADTKYWFKKDVQTAKKSLLSSLKASPVIFIAVFVVGLAGTYYVSGQVQLSVMLFYTLVLSPVFMLGYFLIHIMVTKGYNIHASGGGTTIDVARHNKRSKDKGE